MYQEALSDALLAIEYSGSKKAYLFAILAHIGLENLIEAQNFNDEALLKFNDDKSFYNMASNLEKLMDLKTNELWTTPKRSRDKGNKINIQNRESLTVAETIIRQSMSFTANNNTSPQKQQVKPTIQQSPFSAKANKSSAVVSPASTINVKEIVNSPNYKSGKRPIIGKPTNFSHATKVSIDAEAPLGLSGLPQQWENILMQSDLKKESIMKNVNGTLRALIFITEGSSEVGGSSSSAMDKMRMTLNKYRVDDSQPLKLEDYISPEDPTNCFDNIQYLDVGTWKVYKAIDKKSKADVAIKIVQKSKAMKLDELTSEIAYMRELGHHPNITGFVGAYKHKDGNEIWIVMQYMNGGKLTRLLDDGHFTFSEPQIACVCFEILNGLNYMHTHNRMHRDIKTDNILLNVVEDTVEIKLADLGFCTSSNKNLHKTLCIGSTFWMAPEMISSSETYDEKCDIWSFGILIIELAEGLPPYFFDPPVKVLMNISVNPPPKLKDASRIWSNELIHFLGLCLEKDPVKRATANQLLQHPFLEYRCSPMFLKKYIKIMKAI